jgi:hypothetical protein
MSFFFKKSIKFFEGCLGSMSLAPSEPSSKSNANFLVFCRERASLLQTHEEAAENGMTQAA